MPNSNQPQVLITPLKPALILGMAQKLPVLVRVQTPDAEPSQKTARKPYHLSLVIDRSGSMSGVTGPMNLGCLHLMQLRQ